MESGYSRPALFNRPLTIEGTRGWRKGGREGRTIEARDSTELEGFSHIEAIREMSIGSKIMPNNNKVNEEVEKIKKIEVRTE